MLKIISAFMLFLIVITPTISTADLVDKGGGLIYDTAQNITWTKTADPMGVNLIPPKNGLTIPDLNAELTTFTYAGYSGWRLPTGPNAGTDTGGEFYNLWYELGNTGTSGLAQKGPFTQLNGGWYWTSGQSGPGYNYVFDWTFGWYVGGSNINTQDLAIWLVHDGELTYQTGGDDGDDGDGDNGNSTVPEPATFIMLATGAGLLGCKRIKR